MDLRGGSPPPFPPPHAHLWWGAKTGKLGPLPLPRRVPLLTGARIECVRFPPLFICGEAGRSGRGRCCSSSSSSWGIWGDCFQISHVHSKKEHPEKTFLHKGCIQRKLFFKRGAFRENFSSKGVHPEKSFPQKGCIQTKLFFKRGVSRQKFSSKWVHQDKTLAFLLMWVSRKLDNIPVKFKSETNAADQWKDPFLVWTRGGEKMQKR